MSDKVYETQCSQEGCEEVVPKATATKRTSSWDLLRATQAGWFTQKDGQVWCPKHVPDWVEGWRAEQREK